MKVVGPRQVQTRGNCSIKCWKVKLALQYSKNTGVPWARRKTFYKCLIQVKHAKSLLSFIGTDFNLSCITFYWIAFNLICLLP